MPSSPLQMPSPCSTDNDHNFPPDIKPTNSAINMLKIHALLNPSAPAVKHERQVSISPPLTPAYTHAFTTPASTPRPRTPIRPTPVKRQKLVKDAAIFIRGTARAPINYPPSESAEDATCLTVSQQEELARQHHRFHLYPNGRGDQGLISDFQRHIPYSSEKKSFFGKTNRDAFEVFTYTFRVPADPDNVVHTVMWDYQVGLVRITPFFKALKYSKTTPAKALTTNDGLKELSHSITGGALAAQGYWMPFECARAICLTFCYPIRWALTPIFGPSFLQECLRPEHAGYCRFKIGSEIIRNAQREAEGIRTGDSSRSASPASHAGKGIVRSALTSVPLKALRPRPELPTFKHGSPFESDSDASSSCYNRTTIALDSPQLSPKTFRPAYTWTSVNRPHPLPPNNTPVGLPSQLLLTEPRTLPTTSWRALDPVPAANPTTQSRTDGQNAALAYTRRISSKAGGADINPPNRLHSTQSSSASESDDMDILTPPPMTRKRQRSEAISASVESTPRSAKAGRSTKYTAADARAAQWLLNLSVRDSQLAGGMGEDMERGLKRRNSVV